MKKIFIIFFYLCSLTVHADSPKKGIFIMSVARSTSTLLYKVFLQIIEQRHLDEQRFIQDLKQTASLLEPFSQPYYLENNLIHTPGLTLQEELSKTSAEAFQRVLSHNGKFVVAKDLAHQCQSWLLPQYQDQLNQMLKRFEFVFLIRSPEETIPSGFDPYFQEKKESQFSATDVGFKELFSLFDHIRKKTGTPPLVIEAEDYLSDPEKTLPPYFESLGFQFKKEYLSWKKMTPEEVASSPDFRLWGNTWYGVLIHSTGLKTQKGEAGKSRYPNTVQNHPLLKAIYEEQLPYYLQLKTQGRRP